MARLSYRARKALPDSAFALPEDRKLPLTDAKGRLDQAHIGNAAARLSMMKHRGTISHGDYARARGAILRAEKKTGMRGSHLVAYDNPVGDFVMAHPWMTFFLGLAALNTVGWIVVAGLAASQKGSAPSTPTYNPQNLVPVPVTTSPTIRVGDSMLLVTTSGATNSPVDATTSNSTVLTPAAGVTGGFVAVAPGSAQLTTAAGAVTTVTVVMTGTAGVGKPKAPQMPVLRIIPSLLRPRRAA